MTEMHFIDFLLFSESSPRNYLPTNNPFVCHVLISNLYFPCFYLLVISCHCSFFKFLFVLSYQRYETHFFLSFKMFYFVTIYLGMINLMRLIEYESYGCCLYYLCSLKLKSLGLNLSSNQNLICFFQGMFLCLIYSRDEYVYQKSCLNIRTVRQ